MVDYLVERKYAFLYSEKPLVDGTDGYGTYLDGYDESGFVDGYNITYKIGEDTINDSIFIYDAWKHRLSLDYINLAIKSIQDGYAFCKLDVEERNRDNLKTLCKAIDRRDSDEQYDRVCTEYDIRSRKYPKDRFIKTK